MPNTLRHFNPLNPTAPQLRDMTRILTFSRMTHEPTKEARRAGIKRKRLTLFGLSMFLRLSSSRVKSLVDGIRHPDKRQRPIDPCAVC